MLARRLGIGTILTFALAGGACAPQVAEQAAAPAVDSAGVKAALSDLWSRYAMADTAGDVAALLDTVSDSVQLDIRGFPRVMGREAWRGGLEGVLKEVDYTSMDIAPERTTVSSNELVYEYGAFREGYTTKGKKFLDHGRYASAVRKDADGKWRIAYLMAFVDSTATVK
ncbi:MAG: SnoaL-like domain-containing protein [Gemmatimonadales bacterium]|nr:SnoaL-like domain-containing protein [Gemmatimonadales bacterium]